MALFREWNIATQGGATVLNINHRLVAAGLVVAQTTLRLNGTVRIGHDSGDMNELDNYLSSQWTDGLLFSIREWLREDSETPGNSLAKVRQACVAVLGAENTTVQIL